MHAPRAWPGAATLGAAGFLALQGADAMLPLAWLALVLGGALALWRDEIDFVRPPDRLEWSLAAFVAVAAFASACGLDPRRSLSLSQPVLAAAIVWTLVARGRPEPRRAAWIAAGLLAAALTQIVLVLIAAAALPDAAPGERVARAGALWLVVPNDLAWIACLVPFALLLPRPRRAVVAAGAGALALAWVVPSVTLAGTALVTTLAALWFGAGRRLPCGAAVAAGYAALAVTIAAAAFVRPSMQARLQLWQAALVVLREHPLGVGLHNYVLAYRGASPDASMLVDPRRTPWPHNLPLEIGAELGWLGLAALALVVTLLRAVLRSMRRNAPDGRFDRVESALVASLAGFAALAISETSLLRMWTWLFGAALLGLIAYCSREKRKHG
ncbi:O-antigen ligase family protein [Tahibacter soli]|uniref:O-antigen ligase family protein n=1 Tax=Tahibacter soli TaxID=2983605 RepID=A0A9X3YP63_9GAMM|nr:O-antigen ligase family protein [Tahibacter soli]MDC8015907.1 O-antigen ligase family protein [Tahibacter soli]